MRNLFKETGNIVLVIFGFLTVFFIAESKPFTGILSQDGSIGTGVAHADAPSCVSGDAGCAASTSGDGSGSGGCSGSGGSGGCDSGDGGCGCGGSC